MELDTDALRQGQLTERNSADAPVEPDAFESLKQKYPEWYL